MRAFAGAIHSPQEECYASRHGEQSPKGFAPSGCAGSGVTRVLKASALDGTASEILAEGDGCSGGTVAGGAGGRLRGGRPGTAELYRADDSGDCDPSSGEPHRRAESRGSGAGVAAARIAVVLQKPLPVFSRERCSHEHRRDVPVLYLQVRLNLPRSLRFSETAMPGCARSTVNVTPRLIQPVLLEMIRFRAAAQMAGISRI